MLKLILQLRKGLYHLLCQNRLPLRDRCLRIRVPSIYFSKQFEDVHNWSRYKRPGLERNGYWYDQNASPSIPTCETSSLGRCSRWDSDSWISHSTTYWRCSNRCFQLASMLRDQPSLRCLLLCFHRLRLSRSCAELQILHFGRK